MRLLSIVLVLAACGEVRQVNRWPSHRREKDAQLDMLAQKAITLEARIERLERELATLRRTPRDSTPSPPPP
jgi:hypothetical protein